MPAVNRLRPQGFVSGIGPSPRPRRFRSAVAASCPDCSAWLSMSGYSVVAPQGHSVGCLQKKVVLTEALKPLHGVKQFGLRTASGLGRAGHSKQGWKVRDDLPLSDQLVEGPAHPLRPAINCRTTPSFWVKPHKVKPMGDVLDRRTSGFQHRTRNRQPSFHPPAMACHSQGK